MRSIGMCLAIMASFIGLLCSSFVLAAQDSEFRSPSVGEIASLPYVSHLAVSPDGESFAYLLDNTKTLFTASLSGREQPVARATGVEPVSKPRWSPDGHTIAFYCATGEGLQVCLLDVISAGVRQLTHMSGGFLPDYGIYANDGDTLDLEWSDDSTRIAFEAKPIPATSPISPRSKPTLVFSGDQDGDPLAGLSGFPLSSRWRGCDSLHSSENFAIGLSCGYSQIFVVDVRTGAVKQITQNQEHHFEPIWSADSKSLWCVTVDGGRRSRLDLPTTQIVEVDISSGAEKVVVPRGQSMLRLRRSPDGKLIAFEKGGFREYIPWSLVVITKTGKTIVDTRKLIDRNVVDFAWSDDSQTIVLNIRDGVRQRLLRLDIGSQAVSDIPLDTNWVTGFGLGPDNMIVFFAEDGTTLNEVRITHDNGRRVESVVKINPETAEWKLGKQKIVRWKNSRGEHLEGVLILPTDFAAGQTYPLIVDMRGSSSYDGFQRDRWDANQLLAQHDYAIFYPILRPFYYPMMFAFGDQFHRFRRAPEAIELMADDVNSGVEALIRSGVAQRGSVGLMGFSVGGYGALQMAIHSKIFTCVVAAGTVYADWSREYLLFSDSIDLRSRIGGMRLWDAPDLYRELSIVYSLDRIQSSRFASSRRSRLVHHRRERGNLQRIAGTPHARAVGSVS